MKKKADWEIAIEKTNEAIDRTHAGIDKMKAEMAERDKAMNAKLDKTNEAIDKMKVEAVVRDKAVNAKLIGIGVSNGIVAETFFAQAMEDGLTLMINGKKAFFEQTATNLVIYDKSLIAKAEIDVFMVNGNFVLLIETKYRLDKRHIEQIPKTIEMLQKYSPDVVKGKTILTAFASMGCQKDVKEFLTENGHFVFTEKNDQLQTAYPVNF